MLGWDWLHYLSLSLSSLGKEVQPFMLAFIHSRSVSLLAAPTRLAITLPFLKRSSVGIEEISNFSDMAGFASTSTLPNFSPFISSESWSTMGESILHGPHQAAQKSTKSTPAFASLSKFSSVRVIMSCTSYGMH